MNVSAGMTITLISVFPRGSGYNYTTFTLSTWPPVNATPVCTVLPNGDHQLALTFDVKESHNGAVISTLATLGGHTIAHSTARLKVQGLLSVVGELNTTKEPNNCQNITRLNFSWKAPFTLEGVPIRFYTVNITGSNGQLLKTDTTTVPEYHYNASRQLHDVTFAVAAVNDVGVGNISNITIPESDIAIPSE